MLRNTCLGFSRCSIVSERTAISNWGSIAKGSFRSWLYQRIVLGRPARAALTEALTTLPSRQRSLSVFPTRRTLAASS
jgi:hypothetical protein